MNSLGLLFLLTYCLSQRLKLALRVECSRRAFSSSAELYHQALEIADAWRFSFYDALIVAAALEAKCQVLYSEDLQADQRIKGLTVRNPF